MLFSLCKIGISVIQLGCLGLFVSRNDCKNMVIYMSTDLTFFDAFVKEKYPHFTSMGQNLGINWLIDGLVDTKLCKFLNFWPAVPKEGSETGNSKIPFP